MHFNVIQQLTDLDALAEEWNALLHHSASHVPFLRHEYMREWWRTLGGGEWPEGELFVVTARADGGQLVGVAPLFFTQNRQSEPAMMLVGSIEISDYLDLIAPQQYLPEFVDELLSFITGRHAPAWITLDFYNLLDSSPTLKVLQDAASRKGWLYSQETLQHCPYIPLPDDWEVYLAGIDKKQRHEIRRKMRRAEQHALPVRWYIVDDADKLEAEMEAFFKLMACDPEKERFLTQKMREQMQATARAAMQQGWLQLAFVEVGGEKAAGYLNFDYNDQIWVYNSGFDLRFRELSLGWVLLGYLIQWSIENKRTAFDFMRGNEDYKYRFGAVDRRVVRARIKC